MLWRSLEECDSTDSNWKYLHIGMENIKQQWVTIIQKKHTAYTVTLYVQIIDSRKSQASKNRWVKWSLTLNVISIWIMSVLFCLFVCLYIIHCRTKILMVIHQFCLAPCNSNTDLCQELDWLKRGIRGAKFHQFPAWQRRRLGLDSLVGLESLSLIDLEKITVVSMLQMKSESVWKVC